MPTADPSLLPLYSFPSQMELADEVRHRRRYVDVVVQEVWLKKKVVLQWASPFFVPRSAVASGGGGGSQD